MKKSIRVLIALMLVGVLSLALVGCGDAFGGNYKEVSEAEANAALTSVSTAIQADDFQQLNGYKLSGTMKVSGYGSSVEVSYDTHTALVNGAVAQNVKVSTKMSAGGINSNVEAQTFIKDNVLYVKSGDVKIKIDYSSYVDEESGFSYCDLAGLELFDLVGEIVGTVDVTEIESEGIKVLVDKSDDTVKVKYELTGFFKENGATAKEAYAVIIVKNGKLEGMKLVIDATVEGTTMKYDVKLEKSGDAVSIPSTDGYTEVAASAIDSILGSLGGSIE